MEYLHTGPAATCLCLILIALTTALASADIHCYCNVNACAESGFRCRSELGRCFSKMSDHPQVNDTDNSLHGCVESLALDERSSCLSSGRGDVITRKTNVVDNMLPILMCCTSNMCNYIQQIDPPHVAIDVFTLNTSAKEGSLNRNNYYREPHSSEYYSSYEVWFKAAVIAVPIAGGVILVVLVLLALRMLRYDSRQYQIKREQSFAKAQSYVTDHFSHPFIPSSSSQKHNVVYVEKECEPSSSSSSSTSQGVEEERQALYDTSHDACASDTHFIDSACAVNNYFSDMEHQQLQTVPLTECIQCLSTNIPQCNCDNVNKPLISASLMTTSSGSNSSLTGSDQVCANRDAQTFNTRMDSRQNNGAILLTCDINQQQHQQQQVPAETRVTLLPETRDNQLSRDRINFRNSTEGDINTLEMQSKVYELHDKLLNIKSH